MKTYLVGGAVRDKLLGLQAKDRDYVVVGSSAEEMLADGYEQVGTGFPVFLHPKTGEEYALARREKKVGAGYTGFEFDVSSDVTLEEDLSRRDLTINSMAMDADDNLIDPFGGSIDLECRVLRHTSDAFGEDPLRIVRLARFYARYSRYTFTVADSTMKLAKEMIDRGDLDELKDERFWRELEKVLSDYSPEKFFELLFKLDGLNKIDFFTRAFGGNVTWPDVAAMMQVARKCSLLDKSLRLDVFVALLAPAEVKSFFSTVRSAHLYNSLQVLKGLNADCTGQEVNRLLTSSRAWSESTTADDLVTAVRTFDNAVGKHSFALTGWQLKHLLAAGRAVTSEPFQHLTGKEIGDAMSADRTSRFDRLLNRNL